MVRRLNLDELIPERSVVLLDDKEHHIEAQSTEAWLRIMNLRERMLVLDEARGGEGEDPEAATGYAELLLNTLVDIAVAACPSIPEERLRQLPFAALSALAEVIGEEVAAGMPSADEEVGGEPEGEAEPEAAES